MQGNDIVNGVFELLGGFLTWMNCRKLRKDKQVKGVCWSVTAFFSVWGLWNLYYYPCLGQWASFVGGIILVAGNLVWVGMAIKYRDKKA